MTLYNYIKQKSQENITFIKYIAILIFKFFFFYDFLLVPHL